MKKVFMQGVRGNRNKDRQALWIVEYWVPWKYYTATILDKWMHLLRKLPFARFLVDEVWEFRYYPLFIAELTDYVPVEPDMVDERWQELLKNVK